MSATLSATAKSSMMTALNTLLNGGSLEIGTAGMASVLATFTLTNPAGTVSGGVLTLDTSPVLSATASASGTAAAARLKDSSGNVHISNLTVATSGAEVNINSVAISSGQTITVNSGTITLP